MRRARFLLCLLILFLSAPSLRAQGRDLSPPSPRETLESYRALESWIRGWGVPETPESIDPTGTTAACVTLRLGGDVLGRATRVDGSGSAIWGAAREAWIKADTGMPVPRDARRRESIMDVVPRVTIDLQLAGPMIPFLGERYDDAARALSPGVDGVAVRTPNGASAMFPGTMLSMNFTPDLALRAAAGELDLPPKKLGTLRAEHGLRTLRFRSRHLAQPDGGEPPVFLHRGGKTVPRRAVTGPALREFASALAEHIMTHDWPGNEPFGMTGDYMPTQNTYDPKIAPPRAQAVASYALLRFSRMDGIEGGVRARAEVFARGVIERLADVTPREPDPLDDPIDAASWLLADSLVRKSERYTAATRDFRAGAIETVSQSARGGVGEGAPAVESPPRRAMLAAALSSIASRDETNGEHASLAREIVLSLYQGTEPGRLVSLMPWLSIAAEGLDDDGGEMLGAVALRSAREDVWDHQLDAADLAPPDRDLAGGIVFTRGRGPLPTWHSLRPLATIAGTLDDPSVTSSDEFMPNFVRLAASLRFVMQLSVREFETHMYRDKSRALGGVRAALWDQRVSLDATSLALITVCETLESAREHASGADGPDEGAP